MKELMNNECMKNDKTAGTDAIAIEMIKISTNVVIPTLYNSVFNGSVCPAESSIPIIYSVHEGAVQV